LSSQIEEERGGASCTSGLGFQHAQELARRSGSLGIMTTPKLPSPFGFAVVKDPSLMTSEDQLRCGSMAQPFDFAQLRQMTNALGIQS
jgi:hypothetical protein